MQRQLEPEYMDTPTEAAAYDAMDHAAVNRQFVDDLLAAVGSTAGPLSAIDLGVGTALIPIELCQRDPRFHVVGIDAAESMLQLARRNVTAADLADRITPRRADAKLSASGQRPLERFHVVMSNTLLHHLPEPAVLLDRAIELVSPGGLLFIRDLFRPASETEWKWLVDTYTTTESETAQRMFAESLRAALTIEEVRALVTSRGFKAETVQATSDRHWTWVTRCLA